MIAIIQGPINSLEVANVILGNVKLLKNEKYIRHIIVGTYKGEFNEYILKNIDALNFELCIYKDPGSSILEPVRGVPLNIDRHLLTSSIPPSVECGIDEPVLKIRNDLKINSFGIWLIRNINMKWDLLKNFIFVIPITTTRPRDLNFPALQVCDWLYILNSQIYSKVFNIGIGPCGNESNIFKDKLGRLSFGSENYITNKILSTMNIANYSNMWEVDRVKWECEFNKHFCVLPYLLLFKNIKYRRVYRNLFTSPIFSQFKSIYTIFFCKRNS